MSLSFRFLLQVLLFPQDEGMVSMFEGSYWIASNGIDIILVSLEYSTTMIGFILHFVFFCSLNYEC